jgi:hypothetical protein
LEIKFKVQRRFSISQLNELLDEGGSVILIYDTKKTGSHAVFIDAKKDDYYRVWNRAKGTKPWCLKKEIAKAIRRSVSKPGHLYAYIFQKDARLKK